jgi:hypothetical protein
VKAMASLIVMMLFGYEMTPPAWPAGFGVHGVVVVVSLS